MTVLVTFYGASIVHTPTSCSLCGLRRFDCFGFLTSPAPHVWLVFLKVWERYGAMIRLGQQVATNYHHCLSHNLGTIVSCVIWIKTLIQGILSFDQRQLISLLHHEDIQYEKSPNTLIEILQQLVANCVVTRFINE
uniref:hypothetical protein n=1 Tax=Alloscardovia omnicolens TaxID=419015 RepID=UPI004037ED2F